MDSPIWVYLLGFSGMAIYGSRVLIQWWMSEKSHQVESPGIYWVLSSIGAVPLYIYGWLRKDFSIILRESIGYYIYMWNIGILGLYKRIPKVVIVLQALFPVAILALIARDFPTFTKTFLHNEYVPMKLLLFGVLGQVIFEARSLYQLIYSYRRRTSILPLGHWVMAVTGSLMIIIYGIIRHDWVLAIGQVSIFFSIRNLMLCFATPPLKSVSTSILMVRPSSFGYNEETAPNNQFQHQAEGKGIQAEAREEFDGMVRLLEGHGIPVTVVEDSPDPRTPDSIFPNNWFSTHSDGTLVLYPMYAPNRRKERRPEVITTIMEKTGIKKVVDLTAWEDKGKFLEGTGSMVLDRKSLTAYACRSPRTSEAVLNDFCRRMGYRHVLFDAVDRNGNPIYHTNVIMSIGEEFALICKDVIISPPEYLEIVRRLSATGRKVVEISYDQMLHFAANILQYRSPSGELFSVMSDTALASLNPEQIETIKGNGSILAAHIPLIEEVGGGSARCMMAELICRGKS